MKTNGENNVSLVVPQDQLATLYHLKLSLDARKRRLRYLRGTAEPWRQFLGVTCVWLLIAEETL